MVSLARVAPLIFRHDCISLTAYPALGIGITLKSVADLTLPLPPICMQCAPLAAVLLDTRTRLNTKTLMETEEELMVSIVGMKVRFIHLRCLNFALPRSFLYL